jgi:hypothetical protein
MERQLPTTCATCPRIVKLGDKWVIHHTPSRGELIAMGQAHRQFDPDTWAIQCRPCSDKSGQQGVIDKAKAEARVEKAAGSLPVLEGGPPHGNLRPSPCVKSEDPNTPVFDPKSVEGVAWLADLLPIPADAAWPLYMSPPPDDAVGSYGVEAEKWIADELGIRLRWWQRFALRMQWAHRADGSLCFRTVIESTPRRAGKSVRLRTASVYRTSHAEIFGEQQLVLLCGKDTAIVLEHHRKTWAWAKTTGWSLRRRTGAEEIEAPDGSRFVIRGKDSTYGYDVGYGIVDEAFGVPVSVVDDGLEPSLLERCNPQLHLVSTSHRRATPLMRRRITAALANGFEDASTLLLMWAAPKDALIGEEAVWRAASPHWTAERRAFIATKYEQALAGTAEPDPDDPDPLASFASQYLNSAWWVDALTPTGESVFTDSEWEAFNGHVPGVPAVAAVEAWFQSGAACSLAEPLGDGRVGVTSKTYDDVPAAIAAAQASGAGVLLVGKSIASGLVGVEPVGGTTRQAAMDLRRFADDGLLSHDSSPDLTEQVLALRVLPSSDGARLVSKSRADVVKSACWAVDRARNAGGVPAIW